MKLKSSLWLLIAIVTVTYAEELNAENQEQGEELSTPVSPVTTPTSEGTSELAQTQTTKDETTPAGSIDNSNTANTYTSTVTTTKYTIAAATQPSATTVTQTIDSNDDFVAHTENGPVRGFPWQGSAEILAYIDIPYGQFKSVFEEPTGPNSWDMVIEAKEHTKRCPQLDGDQYVGTADCLTLSIFTPRSAKHTSVLFYIHESNFISGSGDPAIYGPEYLVERNVTLVLPNYRLGPLGFLCLNDNTAPGNAGLKDLALALNWTKNNINLFGGNPENIAVSGDGTSAALAEYLAISPKSKHLVQKVISDSGSVLSHWAIDRNPDTVGKEFIKKVANQTGKEIGDDIFKDVDMEILLVAARGLVMRPCVELDGYLTDTPWDLVDKQSLSNISFIIGSANHAGLLEALEHNEASINNLKNNFASLLPNDLTFSNTKDKNYIGDSFRKQYFGDGDISLNHSKEFSLYHTDVSYLGPSIRFARALVNAGATVYMYEFSFMGMLNKDLMVLEEAVRHGAVRGDLVGYLFTQDSRIPATETKEKQMVELIADLWVSFLKNSDPSSHGVTWRPLNATIDSDEEWLSIGEETSSQRGLHPDRLRLWTRVYRDHFVDTNFSGRLMTTNILTVLYFVMLTKLV